MGTATSRPTFDTDRYLGRWYELARYPNSYQIGCQDATIDYTRVKNRFRIVNRCHYDGGGSADLSGWGSHIGGSTFRVNFTGSGPVDYSILSTDYDNFAFVASNQGRFWIMGRQPQITPTEKRELALRAEQLGYDPELLIWNQ